MALFRTKVKGDRVVKVTRGASHLDQEEAGCRRGVMVDVDGDQDPRHHDERHQQDAQDQPRVQRVRARCPVHSAVRRHDCGDKGTRV